MADYLGTSDFEGAPIKAPGAVTLGGQATYIGVMTFSNVDRKLVESLLPTGYELAARMTTGSLDVHPVLFLFGDQTDGYYLLPFNHQPTGIHYSEAILAIPFVQKKGESGWHTYIIRMYLDNDAAVAAGFAFGYQKEKAWVDWKGDHARVYKLTGTLLRAWFRWGDKWRDYPTARAQIPNFADAVDMMKTRILGETAGAPICSFWEWDFKRARIATARTSYKILKPLRSDMTAWPALSPFKNVDKGAFVIRGMRWRLAGTAALCLP